MIKEKYSWEKYSWKNVFFIFISIFMEIFVRQQNLFFIQFIFFIINNNVLIFNW